MTSIVCKAIEIILHSVFPVDTVRMDFVQAFDKVTQEFKSPWQQKVSYKVIM